MLSDDVMMRVELLSLSEMLQQQQNAYDGRTGFVFSLSGLGTGSGQDTFETDVIVASSASVSIATAKKSSSSIYLLTNHTTNEHRTNDAALM